MPCQYQRDIEIKKIIEMSEIPKKNSKTCHCGNTFVRYSTLVTKCPKCQIKAMQSKKESKQDKLPFQVNKFNTAIKTKPKRQKTEKQKAKANAWLWFSRYIRLSNSINGQYVVCYTCGTPHGIKEVDAGHFISRSKDSVLFNENNCKPQCRKCNRFQQGRSYDFEIKLTDEIGPIGMERLKELARLPHHFEVNGFEQIASIYRLKVKQLQQEYGVRIW